MRRFLLIAALAALLPGGARADSDVPALAAGTALTTAAMYLANAGAVDNQLGFTTTTFCIATGKLTICTGGIGATMLASTAVTPGAYSSANITVDQQGRITAAADGTGAPGGTSGQIQFNDSSSFGGFTASGDATINTSTGAVAVNSFNGGTAFGSAASQTPPVASNIGWDGNAFTTGTGGTGCPNGIDTWDGTAAKTISATTGLLYTTPGTPIAAARVLSLPTVATYTLGCPLTVVDLGAIFNSTNLVTPTRQSTDTIDGATTGVTLGAARQSQTWVAAATGKWATVAPPTLASDAAVSNQFVTAIPDTGIITRAQPAFTDLSGTAAAAQLPAATTSAQGAAKLHNVPFSMGWNSATNPNGNLVAVVTQASRITAIKGRIGPAVGAAAVITVKKAASGVDCAASGVALASTTFDANGTPNAVQTLTLVGGATDDLAADDTVCFSTADGAAFLAGSGKGVISIDWAPL